MNTLVRSQVAEAFKTARAHESEARNREPEYTVVANDPAFTGEASIGVYARTYEPTWSFVEAYDGTDAEAVVAALSATGAPVALVTDRANLLMDWNQWQRFVTDFDSVPTPAQRLESVIARLTTRAGAYDREWASSDRWGTGPGGELRRTAQALEVELRDLTKAAKKMQKAKPTEPVKGWYLDG